MYGEADWLSSVIEAAYEVKTDVGSRRVRRTKERPREIALEAERPRRTGSLKRFCVNGYGIGGGADIAWNYN